MGNTFSSGHGYTGKSSWTPAHMRWLSEITFSLSAQQIAFQEYMDAVNTVTLRVDRFTEEIARHIEHWRMRPVVEAFQALRGTRMITAAAMVAEVGGISPGSITPGSS